jgi:hypothetical protein
VGRAVAFAEPDLAATPSILRFLIAGGKSAVLTAITVALGAKAAVTGRGAGIRAFIKNGQESVRWL